MITRPLKILMTADAVGGVWSYCLTLARAMRPYEVSFVLATMGPRPSADQVTEAAAISNLSLAVSDYKLEWMPDPWDDVNAASDWLRSLEQHERPDIIHLNGYSHAAAPFAAPALVVGHSCCLSWWRACKQCDAPADWDEYRERVTSGLRCADAFVAPTAAMLHEYQRLYAQLPPSRVIHNAAAMPRTKHTCKAPSVLTAGRAWDHAKNIGIVGDVAPHLPWPVSIAGDTVGPVGSTALPSTVRQLGRLTTHQMHHALARASIYLHPALYEPFGLLPLEAAHHGCALILADIPTLREVWGDAAVFFDPRDPTDLIRSVRSLTACPERLAACSRLAARQAQSYSIARFASAYANLYAQLAGDTPAGIPACTSLSFTTRS